MSIAIGHFMVVILIVISLNELYTLVFHADIITIDYISSGSLVYSPIIINVHTIQTIYYRTALRIHIQIAISAKYIYITTTTKKSMDTIIIIFKITIILLLYMD